MNIPDSTYAPPPAPVDTPPVDPPVPPVDTPPVTDPTPPAVEEFLIKHGGQEHKLTRDQLIENAQKGFDYTQKAQTLAQQRQLVEQVANVLNGERQRMAQMWENRAALEARIAQLAPAVPELQPDEAFTPEHAQQMIAAKVAEAQKQLREELQTANQTAEVARLEQGYRADIDSSVRQLTEKFTVLTDWMDPTDAQTLLRSAAQRFVTQAIQTNPTQAVNIEDVKKAMQTAAEGQVARIEKRVADQKKMQVVRDHKLVKEGIEPPGGTAPAPPAPTKFKLGSRELTDSVIAEMNKAFA